MNTRLIERFAPVLCGARAPELLMGVSGTVKAYYATFEDISARARIVLVGLTLGPTQMVNVKTRLSVC